MDFAAEPLTGEPVSELVDGAHNDDEHPRHQERPNAQQADEVAMDLGGVGRERGGRDDDERE